METNENGPSEKDRHWKESKQEDTEPSNEVEKEDPIMNESKIFPEQREAGIKFYENQINELKEAIVRQRKAESVFGLPLPEGAEDYEVNQDYESIKTGGWLNERSARKTMQEIQQKYGTIAEIKEKIAENESELQKLK